MVATSLVEPIGPGEMTADQLALSTSERVAAHTARGRIVGARVRNGCQVFLSASGEMEPPGPAGPAAPAAGTLEPPPLRSDHSSASGCRLREARPAHTPPDVPYALPVPRWVDAQPLPGDFVYPSDREYTVDGLYCAQPSRSYTIQSGYSGRYSRGSSRPRPPTRRPAPPSDCP